MAKTVIVSDETIRNLIEANASLSAWYYQMSDALRAAGAGVEPPSEAQRAAFVKQLAAHFPELTAVANAIRAPRPYVPPPVVPAPAEVKENEGIEVQAPPQDLVAAPAMIPQPEPAAEPPPKSAPPASAEPAPPPMVDPSKVKYE